MESTQTSRQAKMRHDLRWEPEVETGWCSHCKKECDIISVDDGIGPYEMHGRRGIHRDIHPVSSCCEENVLDNDPDENP